MPTRPLNVKDHLFVPSRCAAFLLFSPLLYPHSPFPLSKSTAPAVSRKRPPPAIVISVSVRTHLLSFLFFSFRFPLSLRLTNPLVLARSTSISPAPTPLFSFSSPPQQHIKVGYLSNDGTSRSSIRHSSSSRPCSVVFGFAFPRRPSCGGVRERNKIGLMKGFEIALDGGRCTWQVLGISVIRMNGFMLLSSWLLSLIFDCGGDCRTST